MHPNSMNACEHLVESYLMHFPDKSLKVADIGSYDINGSYRRLFVRPNWTYVGFDIQAGPNVDVVVNASDNFSVPTECLGAFDLVISGQCMEHVSAPWRWIKSVAALCKPSGLIWLMVPNTEVYHEYPIDCWRVWPDGMRAILREANLEEVACRVIGPDTLAIARKPCRKT